MIRQHREPRYWAAWKLSGSWNWRVSVRSSGTPSQDDALALAGDGFRVGCGFQMERDYSGNDRDKKTCLAKKPGMFVIFKSIGVA